MWLSGLVRRSSPTIRLSVHTEQTQFTIRQDSGINFRQKYNRTLPHVITSIPVEKPNQLEKHALEHTSSFKLSVSSTWPIEQSGNQSHPLEGISSRTKTAKTPTKISYSLTYVQWSNSNRSLCIVSARVAIVIDDACALANRLTHKRHQSYDAESVLGLFAFLAMDPTPAAAVPPNRPAHRPKINMFPSMTIFRKRQKCYANSDSRSCFTSDHMWSKNPSAAVGMLSDSRHWTCTNISVRITKLGRHCWTNEVCASTVVNVYTLLIIVWTLHSPTKTDRTHRKLERGFQVEWSLGHTLDILCLDNYHAVTKRTPLHTNYSNYLNYTNYYCSFNVQYRVLNSYTWVTRMEADMRPAKGVRFHWCVFWYDTSLHG